MNESYSSIRKINHDDFYSDCVNNDTNSILNYNLLSEISKLRKSADTAFLHGNFKIAEKFYTQCINKNDFSSSTFTQRAKTYFNLHDYDKCESDLNSSIGIDPNNPEPWFLRGKLHYQLKNYDEAIESLRNCRKLDKYDIKSRSLLIKLLKIKQESGSTEKVKIANSDSESNLSDDEVSLDIQKLSLRKIKERLGPDQDHFLPVKIILISDDESP